MNCVSCGKALTKAGGISRCACGGAWVSETHLVEMAEEIKGALVELPWGHRQGAPRACPVCSSPMEMVALVKVALDRCATHGIWFDANELATVLQNAKSLPEELPADWQPAENVRVRDVKPISEHVNLRSTSNRIALVFFELLDGLMKPTGYYTARATEQIINGPKRR